jgi:hypothetical protein
MEELLGCEKNYMLSETGKNDFGEVTTFSYTVSKKTY